MKIVFISPAFYPSIGGVQTHVLEVSQELVRRGHSVTILTEDNFEFWQNRDKSDNEAIILKNIDKSAFFSHKKVHQIDIYYFKFGQNGFLKKFKIWYLLFRNIRLLKDAELVHCHDVFIWYLPFRFLLFKKKVFTTFHGYEGVFPPLEKNIFVRKISERLSKGNICVGDFIKRWYGTKPDFIVYGGTSKVKGLKLKVKSLKLNSSSLNSKLKILLIGRLSKDIGVQIYVDALKNLRKQGVKFEFTACGDGDFRKELEKYGKVLGFVKNTNSYINKADIIFSSSYLTMLSVLQLERPIFAVYNNPLKHDYLYSSPFSKYIYIYQNGKKLSLGIKNYKPNLQRLRAGKNWANTQTWEYITDIYEKLWGGEE